MTLRGRSMGLLEDKMKLGMTIKQGVIHVEDLKTRLNICIFVKNH